uniref:Phytosulfokine n=1 Tax=Kalanchoe fedtschenkoi TaxID=63787 RepID=A0A7N1A0B8_KALFE
MKLYLVRSSASIFWVFLLLSTLFTASASGRRVAAERMHQQPSPATGEEHIIEGSQGDVVMDELLGAENCHSEDVECVQRRLISEAHLDYIYTQRHRP